jgi:transposase-like protein
MATTMMRKLYVCPYCQSEHIHIDGYEDGGGDFGEDLTGVYLCEDCGMSSSEDEALWGYEDQPDDNPDESAGL